MAITITIGSDDFSSQYKNNTLEIRERLENAVNQAKFQVVYNTKLSNLKPDEAKEVIIQDSSRYLFGGFITKIDPVNDFGIGDLIAYDVEAVDYGYIFANKVAQISYKNKTLKYIVEDLISEYIDPSYSIDTTNVETGPTINTVLFNYISIQKCFEKLSEITGYIWYIDYQKNLTFRFKENLNAPEIFTDSSNNYMSVGISKDVSQVRNSIIIRGGREETASTISQDFLGDGEKREFILREKPKTMVSIELDTGSGFVAQDYGVDPLNEDTGFDFMFNFQEKFVRNTATTATLSNTDVLRVTYYYEVPIIVQVKSATSIAYMKTLTGGDGLHEYAINRSDFKSKEEARAYALQQISEYGSPLISGNLITRSGLLSAGSVFTAGQLLTINMPSWDINENTNFLINEVVINVNELGSEIEYIYNINFGGKLFTFENLINKLAGQKVINEEDEELDRLESFDEVLEFSETITKNPNTESISETLSLSESVTEFEIVPPFKWGNYGIEPNRSAKWGKFEWG